MADIKVNIDVNSGDVTIASDRVLTLREQVKILTKELQKPQSPEAFNAIKNKLNETQDSLSKVTTKSKELFGTLSTIPGPIGQISQALQGGIDLLKTFSGFTFKDVKNSFKELGKDIGEITGNITGTSEAIANIGTATPNVTALAEATGDVAEATGDAANATAQAANTTATLANATVTATTATVTATKATILNSLSKEVLINQLRAGIITQAQYDVALAATIATETAATVSTGILARALLFLQSAFAGLAAIVGSTFVAAGTLIVATLGTITYLFGSNIRELYNWIKGVKDGGAAGRTFNEVIAEQARQLQNYLSVLESSNKLNEARAKSQGATEAELYKIQKQVTAIG